MFCVGLNFNALKLGSMADATRHRATLGDGRTGRSIIVMLRDLPLVNASAIVNARGLSVVGRRLAGLHAGVLLNGSAGTEGPFVLAYLSLLRDVFVHFGFRLKRPLGLVDFILLLTCAVVNAFIFRVNNFLSHPRKIVIQEFRP